MAEAPSLRFYCILRKSEDFFSYFVTAFNDVHTVFGVADFHTLEVVVNGSCLVFVNYYAFNAIAFEAFFSYSVESEDVT